MRKYEVKSPGDALIYLTDCQLATVASMAMKKTRPVNEYRRQQQIAQMAIDWMDNMGIDYTSTRAQEVKKSGSVQTWATLYESPQDQANKTARVLRERLGRGRRPGERSRI